MGSFDRLTRQELPLEEQELSRFLLELRHLIETHRLDARAAKDRMCRHLLFLDGPPPSVRGSYPGK